MSMRNCIASGAKELEYEIKGRLLLGRANLSTQDKHVIMGVLDDETTYDNIIRTLTRMFKGEKVQEDTVWTEASGRKVEYRCFKCQKPGHIAKYCNVMVERKIM